ncbi:MAG: hypothetical protein WC690_08630 [bacterium]
MSINLFGINCCVPLIPPAPEDSPFYEITEMPFGDQMRRSLEIADQDISMRESLHPEPLPEICFASEADSASFTADDARVFLRPRFDEQAMIVARHTTPLLFASHRLNFALEREFYSTELGIPCTMNPLSDLTESDSPCMLALFEAGLISRDPALAMMRALIASLEKIGWDFRTYASAHLDELHAADLLAQGLVSREDSIASPLLTDEDRAERASMPIAGAVASLFWMLNLSVAADLEQERQRAAESVQRFNKHAVGEGGPMLRRQRILNTGDAIRERGVVELTPDEFAEVLQASRGSH